MMDLNKEAEEYAIKYKTQVSSEGLVNIKDDFIAGANSKYVQAKILQAQIDVLNQTIDSCAVEFKITGGTIFLKIKKAIKELEEQLKQLENE